MSRTAAAVLSPAHPRPVQGPALVRDQATPAASIPLWRDYLTLTKPGITSFIVLTAGAGYFLAGGAGFWPLVLLLLATGLASGGASALNHLLERGPDALMRRTRSRPLVAGRIVPAAAAAWGIGLCCAGVLLAGAALPAWSAVLLAASAISYVLVYTPLKRVHPASTYAGAIPGALPILAGWTAAGAPADFAGWTLFAIVYLWQLPHFLAIARVCRDDYRSAGFRVLGVTDPGGRTAGRHSLLHAGLLIVVAPAPVLMGVLGAPYAVLALLLGLGYAARALRLVLRPNEISAAKRLFFASLLYLPLLLVAMATDRLLA
jgi:heme o synthase